MKAFALGSILILLLIAFGAYTYLRPAPAYSLAHIERAETPAARERGLSGRADIPEDYGMLFVFPEEGTPAFWMKDMLAPIDIIWISDEGVIAGIESSVATSTYPQSFSAPLPVRYVLETRAGNATKQGWVVGMKLSLPL